MSTYIKFYKSKIIILGAIFIAFWFIGNIIFLICYFTDICIMQKPIISSTNYANMPKHNCEKKLTQGNKLLQLNDYIKALVVTPKNHVSNKKYPLLVVFAPAGKSVKKSESFYKDISSEFTYHGYIIAYVNHIFLGEKAIDYNREVINLVKKNYCISNDISLLGHSDGATISGIISYREKKFKLNKIVLSANGLNKTALSYEKCPQMKMSYLILHNANDELFPKYGTDNYNWLKDCYSCSNKNIKNKYGCLIPESCNGIKLQMCYNSVKHKNWSEQTNIITDFFREE